MFSVLQSLGATMEVSPLAGAGLAAAGAWLRGDREDPAAAEPENNNRPEL